MEKLDAVLALDDQSPALVRLGQPARMRDALLANDRLKLYLSVLQAAAVHAHSPKAPSLDLQAEIASVRFDEAGEGGWLAELPGSAVWLDQQVQIPELPRLAQKLSQALETMAAPVLELGHDDLQVRVQHWLRYLESLRGSGLSAEALRRLTHAQRGKSKTMGAENGEDSLHLTVMDLHKALNQLSAQVASEDIAGAHAWQLAADGSDRPLVAAFMRGLDRTRALKGDHPGLDCSATRDGERLLIQNDIGSNDAHVLVLQVCSRPGACSILLHYSDLHRQRFEFFQSLLEELGARWQGVRSQQREGLNDDEPFWVGVARFEAPDAEALAGQLEAVGELIVFLIDWNRARKRLLAFVDKRQAVAVLREAVRLRCGHMGWLRAGGERLVWNAMAAQGPGVFRLGDRLDEVLGADSACAFLVELLQLCQRAAQAQQSASLLADETRALLARRLQHRHAEFDELDEHAGLCQALAQALSEALQLQQGELPAAARLANKAKVWERQADHLVIRARSLAQRLPQWQELARLIEQADDVADALEEACFVWQLAVEHAQALRDEGQPAPRQLPWGRKVRELLQELSQTVLQATQDHIRALTVARGLGADSDASDHDEFLGASWRVLQAERHADELHRRLRAALAQDWRKHRDAVALQLGNEFSAALEQASDALLVLGHGLRERGLQRIDGSLA